MKLPIWGPQASQWLRLDCRNYRGDRPCAAGVQGVCPADCGKYQAMGHRIVIIKLGALGDVVRTAALLPGLKEAWPQSHITWVSRPNGVRVLVNHPDLDRLLPFHAESICRLDHEHFDLCLSLDKEAGPAALAMRIDAPDKRGIGLSSHGTVYPLNEECVDYFELGLSDQKKFRENTKSYQELIYDAVGLPYCGQRYRLYPSRTQQERAAWCWERWGVIDGEVVIGLNTGAGHAFANKNWPPEKYIALAQRLVAQNAWRVALLGGPEERAINARIADECPGVIDAGCGHSELEFAALVRRCDVMVTGDTMAMHAAIAADVPTIVLFGPTCPQEVDLYGNGEKIITGLACAPCYRQSCDIRPSCMEDISLERVLRAVQRWAAAATDEQRQAVAAEVLA